MLPNLGFHELLIFGAIAIMLFGKRLPDVAKSLGAAYRQFREGVADFQRQMDISDVTASSSRRWTPSTPSTQDRGERQLPTAPKFELNGDEPAGDAESAAESASAGGNESAAGRNGSPVDQSSAESGMGDVAPTQSAGL